MSSTLDAVILEAATRCGAAFSSTCSSAGTTTTLVDLAAVDQGTDASFASGGWIYRPDAVAAGDTVRRITNEGFDSTTGTWTVGRAWTNAPSNAEVYYVFAILPPYDQAGMAESWKRLVNRGLSATWFEDEIAVATGDGSYNTRFVISDETGWTPNEQHIKGVLYRTTNSDGMVFDSDQSKGGRGWDIGHANGDSILTTIYPPAQDQQVIVTAVRTYPTLSDATDETNCPLDLIALRTRYELYRYLNATPQSQGQYAGEEARARIDWMNEYSQHRPGGGVVFS